MHISKSHSPIQLETLTLLERARRILLRRRQAERVCSGFQKRQFWTDAKRGAIHKKLNHDKRLPGIDSRDRISLPLVTNTPSPLSSSLILSRIRDARASYPNHEIRQKQLASRQANNEEKARKEAERLLPSWEKAREAEKAAAYAQVILDTGNAVAVTINFGNKALEQARKDQDGVFINLRERITEALKKAVGRAPSHTLALDVSRDGREHLHGVIAWPGDLQALHDVLKHAAGRWAHKRGSQHQIHLRTNQSRLKGKKISQSVEPLTCGWAGYSIKQAKELKASTGKAILYASPDLKRRAKELYGRIRQQRRDVLSINTDLRAQKHREIAIVTESQISNHSAVVNQMDTNADANHGTRRLRSDQARSASGRIPRRHNHRRNTGRDAGRVHADLRNDRARHLRRAWPGQIRASPRRVDPASAGCVRYSSPPPTSREFGGRLMPAPPKFAARSVDLGFRVPESFRRRLKLEAALRHMTMTQLLETAIRDYVERHPVELPEEMR
ncbi:hypothetical protein AB6806_08985 [Bosea sp. RCC_152_1]|uniref:hypothetical protein n=1 Tax=Bosea sp. RCC_152_1 TaxID=3239228 RepID=UPI00352361AD